MFIFVPIICFAHGRYLINVDSIESLSFVYEHDKEKYDAQAEFFRDEMLLLKIHI